MRPTRPLRELLKRVIFGPRNFPQQCSLGMRDPQPEVLVRLCGLGEARDVTQRHLMACGLPFTIGIGLDEEFEARVREANSLSLSFHERNSRGRLLGKIGLRPTANLAAGNSKLWLFQPRSYSNYCLPKPWLWSRYLYYWRFRGDPQTSDLRLTTRELHSMFVFYICPRPVVLATAGDGEHANIFPMNLMGSVGDGYFSFALNSTRPVTSFVERTGRIALSSVPVEQSAQATAFARNHRKEHIDWKELPFATRPSTAFGVPVPEFALRVREMQIESVHNAGSHKLFIARVIHDEHRDDGLEFFVVHGIYQAYRQRLQHSPA
jgi:flavin reductase (DIM6/NTAB) family NADH-FMN oxidoreductase RutF